VTIALLDNCHCFVIVPKRRKLWRDKRYRQLPRLYWVTTDLFSYANEERRKWQTIKTTIHQGRIPKINWIQRKRDRDISKNWKNGSRRHTLGKVSQRCFLITWCQGNPLRIQYLVRKNTVFWNHYSWKTFWKTKNVFFWDVKFYIKFTCYTKKKIYIYIHII